jgi:hypothetical protein
MAADGRILSLSFILERRSNLIACIVFILLDIIVRYVDPLLGNDRETSHYPTADDR